MKTERDIDKKIDEATKKYWVKYIRNNVDNLTRKQVEFIASFVQMEVKAKEKAMSEAVTNE